MIDRYDTSGISEGQFQPGSNGQVLLNRLGVTELSEMNDIELDLLEQLTGAVINDVSEEQTITSEDLCEWHRCWLGNIYEWGGQYRSVNMGKGNFQFAAAHLVPRLMQEFNSKYLLVYT